MGRCEYMNQIQELRELANRPKEWKTTIISTSNPSSKTSNGKITAVWTVEDLEDYKPVYSEEIMKEWKAYFEKEMLKEIDKEIEKMINDRNSET
jgi:hypothetical protein